MTEEQAFLEREEGRVLHSYQDKAGVWTIGVGSTMYQSGKRVGPGETITDAEADALRDWEIKNKSVVIQSETGNLNLKPNQVVPLISFTYNEGVGALASSTLLKVIKKNPNDTTLIGVDEVEDVSVRNYMIKHGWKSVNKIRMCFMLWNKVKNPKTGVKEYDESIMQRRLREADLYLKQII